jgi:hypothetical protein
MSETETEPPVESAVDSAVVSVLFAVDLRPSSQFKDVSLAQIGATDNSSVPRQKYSIWPPVWVILNSFWPRTVHPHTSEQNGPSS